MRESYGTFTPPCFLDLLTLCPRVVTVMWGSPHANDGKALRDTLFTCLDTVTPAPTQAPELLAEAAAAANAGRGARLHGTGLLSADVYVGEEPQPMRPE